MRPNGGLYICEVRRIISFELGLLNAWILVIPMAINFFSDVRATNARSAGVEKKGLEYLNTKERRTFYAVQFTVFALFVYAVFLPLQLYTTWFFCGLLIYLAGLIFTSIAVVNFASSPKNKPVTKGLYRISRNPMYAGWLTMNIGLGIACTSSLYLVLAAVLLILFNAVLPSEERWGLETYGDAYREYLNKTPRWIGMSRSSKNARANR
jgi:protein-S-isoprenylcysteine O-methyltransferase Ste14